MSSTRIALGLAFLASCLVAGCSKDTPPQQPNYGDPALVVEGTEVWQPIPWGWRAPFDLQDTNGDEYLDIAEFSSMGRKNVSQRAIKIFPLLDTNNDDRLSWPECRQQPGDALIISFDVDENGALSVEEFGPHYPPLVVDGRIDACFLLLDRNGDGELVAWELDVPPYEMGFFWMDHDADGRVSLEEYLAVSANSSQLEQRRIDFANRDLDRDGFLTPCEDLYTLMEAKFWRMDTDRKKSVSLEEFSASPYAKHFADAVETFQGMDLNSDGMLAIGEFRDRGEDLAAAFGSSAVYWLWDKSLCFARLDLDENGELSREEVYSESVETSLSPAFLGQFTQLDVDKNGHVDLEEFSNSDSGIYFHFPGLDRNRDGVLSKEEFAEFLPPYFTSARHDLLFAAADADGDGLVSWPEYGSRGEPMKFYMSDVDEDDRICLEEFAEPRRDLVANGQITPAFRSHDLDGNGWLDKDEFDGIQ